MQRRGCVVVIVDPTNQINRGGTVAGPPVVKLDLVSSRSLRRKRASHHHCQKPDSYFVHF
jgi:hypothetical protein